MEHKAHTSPRNGIVDTTAWRDLVNRFCQATGYAALVLAQPDKTPLAGTEWPYFQHILADSSSKTIADLLHKSMAKQFGENVYICGNGLAVGKTAVMVGNTHVADLYLGQVLLKPVEKTQGDFQADTIPLVTISQFESALSLLADMLAQSAEQRASLAANATRVREKERLRLALSVLHEGIWDWDVTTDSIYFDDPFYHMTGYERDALKSTYTDWVRLVHPDDIDHVKQATWGYINGTSMRLDVEFRFKRKDGAWIWLRARGRVVERDSYGKPLRLMGTHTNVTDRRQAQETLHKEQVLFSSGPVMMLQWAPSEGWPVRFASQNSREILGYTPDELMAADFRYADLVHPEDLAQVAQEVERHIAQYEDTYEQSYRLKRKDDTYRWFYDFTRLIRDNKGKVIAIYGYIFDQTRLKDLERELKTEQRRLAYIIEGTNVGTWEWNVKTGAIVVNERWAKIIGYTVQEIAPTTIDTWHTFAHPEDLEHANALLAKHFAGESDYYECEVRMRHKRGDWIWVLDRGRVATWTSEGKPLLMSGTHQDITKRKRLEEANKKRIVALTRPMEDKQSVDLTELFALNDIQRLQDEFAKATGVASIITQPDGKPITRPSGFCRLCSEVVRKTRKGRANCLRSDALIGGQKQTVPRLQNCLGVGLRSAGAPITVGGRHIANWVIGQVRDDTIREASITAYAREIGADAQEMLAAYREVPVMPKEQFCRVAQALRTLAEQLSTTAYQNVQQARFITALKQAEEKLRQSEENLANFFNTNIDFLWVMDQKGKIIAINDTVRRRLGYTTKELVGHSILLAIPAKFREEAKKLINTSLEGKWHAVSIPIQARDGSRIPAETYITTGIWNSNKAVFGISKDISALKFSEEKFAKAFHTSPAIIGLSNLATGKFVEVNQAFYDVLGFDRGEVIGRSSLELLRMGKEFRAKTVQKLKQQGYIRNLETLLYKKDGTGIHVLLSAEIITLQDKQYNFTTAIDITERKRAEEKLRESEERFRALTELLPEAIIELDSQYIITYANQKSFTLFGYSAQDLQQGLRALDMVMPKDRQRVAENITSRMKGKNLGALEYMALRKDGTTFPMLFNASIKYKAGKAVGLRGIIVDITERKRAEAEQLKLKKLESVGVLAGGIAHDFNNLLTGLFGNIELAKMLLSKDSKARRFLDAAGHSMDGATTLTKQLLTFAKGGEPVKEALSIAELIAETALFSLRGSNVKLHAAIPPDLWLVEADKGQLGQVISNLAINAQQAMPAGGSLFLSAENVVTGTTRQVKITFQDQGVGIAPQYLDKIFDPYFTTKQQGSGLGLAITHSIISKHNGSITVDSTLDQGTTFTILLPASSHEAVPAETSLAQETDATSAAGARILVLDDDAAIREILGSMLQFMGCHVDYTSTGTEAVAKFKQESQKGAAYDVVITDLTIPGGMGGTAVAKAILAEDPQAKVIVSSGYATDPVIAHYDSYGFSARVVKPYRFTELKQVITDILAK